MKSLSSIFLSFLFSICFFSALQGQDLWFKAGKAHQGFSTFFPDRPSEAENLISTEIGEVNQETFYLNRDEGPVYFYQVNFIAYPEHTIHSDSTEFLEEFFNETIDAAAKEMKGELVYSSDIEEKGFRGKLYRIDYKEDRFTLKAKTFVVRNRYYSIQVIFKKGQEYRAVDRFLDSFRIIPVKGN